MKYKSILLPPWSLNPKPQTEVQNRILVPSCCRPCQQYKQKPQTSTTRRELHGLTQNPK